MLAVPKFGKKRDVGFENRRQKPGRGTAVGSAPGVVEIRFTARRQLCREEQFLRAYRNKHTKAELNDGWIPCSALFILKRLRGFHEGRIRTDI